jgi:minor capsid protein
MASPATPLEALLDYLEDNGFGTGGQNLFMNFSPPLPDALTLLVAYPGALPQMTFGAAPFVVDAANIQITCRGLKDDFDTMKTQADAIRTLLAAIANQSIHGFNFFRVEATGSVSMTGVDDSDRPLFSCNYKMQWLQ